MIDKAQQIRDDVIRVAVKNGAGHIAPSLSCIEILVELFYRAMEPEDKFILSKAHGGYGYYSILADKGLLPKEQWELFRLPGCVERMTGYGILAGCGSLGHGLPLAVGVAWGLRLQRAGGRIWCLMGDGECQEGTTWEAVQFAVHHKLDNLTIIIDDNNLQAMDFTRYVIGGNLGSKFKGFGLHPWSIDGHNFKSLKQAFRVTKPNEPHLVIAHTVKGKGLPFMENIPRWHFRVPSEDELSQ
jgi:transketolase